MFLIQVLEIRDEFFFSGNLLLKFYINGLKDCLFR